MKCKTLLAALFGFCALLQINDPDPLPWFAIYACASGTAILSVFVRLPPVIYATVGTIAFTWIIFLLPAIIDAAAFTGTEEEREFAGLTLVVGGMAVLYFCKGCR